MDVKCVPLSPRFNVPGPLGKEPVHSVPVMGQELPPASCKVVLFPELLTRLWVDTHSLPDLLAQNMAVH